LQGEHMTQTNLATPTNAMPKGLLKGWILILVAAIVAYGLYLYLPYDQNANKGLALLAFIGILWLTEAIHITITTLLVPVMSVLLARPMFSGEDLVLITTPSALANSADPVILLFCGGFDLAAVLHIQNLDRKIAMWIISLCRGHLGISVLAIFVVTALLAM